MMIMASLLRQSQFPGSPSKTDWRYPESKRNQPWLLLAVLTIGLLISFWWFLGTAEAAWRIILEFEMPDPAADGGYAVNRVVLGTETTATDQFDAQWDTLAYSGGALKAASIHPEYASSRSLLWQDIQGEGLPKTWTIETRSEKEGQVTMSWKLDGLPENSSVTLEDADSGSILDMRNQSSYTFQLTVSRPKTFTIKVSQSKEFSDTTLVNHSPSSTSSSAKGGGCGYLKVVNQDLKTHTSIWNTTIFLVILLLPAIAGKVRKIANPF